MRVRHGAMFHPSVSAASARVSQIRPAGSPWTTSHQRGPPFTARRPGRAARASPVDRSGRRFRRRMERSPSATLFVKTRARVARREPVGIAVSTCNQACWSQEPQFAAGSRFSSAAERAIRALSSGMSQPANQNPIWLVGSNSEPFWLTGRESSGPLPPVPIGPAALRRCAKTSSSRTAAGARR